MRYRWIWVCSLGLFVVAALTGVLFRFGMVYGWTGGFDLEHIRHAHSHLMYFGWGTPVLMTLIWTLLPHGATREWGRAFRWVVGFILGAAVLAYPLFLRFGYTPVQIGSARLPIAVVGASLNMVGWYGFVGLYVATTRALRRTVAIRLWDLAVLALVLATLGAWGLALVQPIGIESPILAMALTHVFLDLFSEGWFVLGVLGVGFALLESETDGRSEWPIWLVALGLPLTFLLGLPQSALSPAVLWIGRMGGTVVGICMLALAIQLGQRLGSAQKRWLWAIPIGFLVVKACAQLLGSMIPALWLGGSHALRILYLHLMLLGFVSLGLVAAGQRIWPLPHERPLKALYGAVGGVILSIVLLVPDVPNGGLDAYAMAAWVALLPVLALGWLLVSTMRVSTREGEPVGAHTTPDADPQLRVADER